MTSSGKSTFLQRLTQMPFFPSDRQMCTKVPIKIEMRRGFGEPKATVRVYSYHDQRGFVADEPEGEALSIAAASTEVQDKMNSLLERAGFQKNAREVISNKELRIRLSSSALPLLDVVDLPGVVGGSRPFAIATQSLLQRYIRSSGTHSIFFYVIPATLAATEWNAELLGQGDNELHERSVGIIAKCDVMAATGDGEGVQILCEYLRGDLKPEDKLGHGFFALGAHAKGKAREEEALFTKLFSGRSDTESLKKLASISSLQSKVRELYINQVNANCVPTLVRKLLKLWVRSCLSSQTEKMELCDDMVEGLLKQHKQCCKLDLKQVKQQRSQDHGHCSSQARPSWQMRFGIVTAMAVPSQVPHLW
eukprot:Skav212728  [mRNA]  locus=scaffold1734:233416:234507:- [translate_table: standard]